MQRGAIVVAIGFWVTTGTAQADGRYCERTSPMCWDCADITFPAATPCSAPMGCAPGELCVDQSGVPTCFTPTAYCCEAPPCTIPPGCPGAASVCGTGGPGRDNCTFLSTCGPAMDAGTPAPDAGAPLADAGSDAGNPVVDAGQDAGGTAADAGPAIDAGGGKPIDAGAPIDPDAGSTDAGAIAVPDASAADAGSPPTEDAGGCGCRTAPPPTPLGPAASLIVLALALTIRRRRPT